MRHIIPVIFIISCFLSCIRNEKGALNFKENDQATGVVSPIISGKASYTYKNLYDYILKPKCVSCHSGEHAKPKKDPVRLDHYADLLQDRFVPVLKKGHPEKSSLYTSVFKGKMPPKKKGKAPLTQEEISFIKKWIERCAPEREGDSENCIVNTPPPSTDEPGDDEPGDDEPGDGEPSDDEPQ